MNFKSSNMTVNTKFVLVCLIANAIFCSGLPQNYCQHEIDHDEMIDCDEAGDNPWSYGQMRGVQNYDHPMMKSFNDEGYFEIPRKFRPQNYMSEVRNLAQNYEPPRDYLKGMSYQPNPMSPMHLAANPMRFSKSAQMQPFAYPGHYYDSLAAYDEPSYYHPMLNYYGGYSPDELEDEYNDDCSTGKCPQMPSVEDNKESSGKKSKKNHDKRHNSRAEKMSSIKAIANEGSMIHADEIEEETIDKDSWGIDRREKQKNKEMKLSEDNLKGKRSIEKGNMKNFNDKQDDLERTKKHVKQVDTTNTEKIIPAMKPFIHQIMHIPKNL
ncbi:uncharacterized protein LOC122510150 [Leptopilina heterotoma]|uniref:uncharacterized protein LOC122510150 n=1 Tax=Leptopilina heterotoma TaxID=63436 RepID=UPI001CA870B3|nr:uncharacterized protein LOC122510150 [Leptopilina heterotoma]